MHPWFRTFLAGVGILSDAFNLFSINLVKNVMAIKYPQTQGQTSAISSAALAGAIIGQLTFGSLADRLGRRTIFVTTIAIVIIGALGSATVVQSDTINIYTQLTLWLLLLGLGIGGEYPLSASVSSEGSDNKTTSRGKSVGATFAMQGVGNLLASLTMFILLSSNLNIDWVWRIALGAGAVPGILTVYFRYKMEESSHYKKHAASRASSMAPSVAATPRLSSVRRGSALVGSMTPTLASSSSPGGPLVPGSARTIHLPGQALDFSSNGAGGNAGKSSAIDIHGGNSNATGSIALAPVGSGSSAYASSYPNSAASATSSFMLNSMPPPSPSSSSVTKKSVSINNNPVTLTPETGRQARAARASKAGKDSTSSGGGPSKSPVSLRSSLAGGNKDLALNRETTSNSYSSSGSGGGGSYLSSSLDLHVAEGDGSGSSLLANEHASPSKDSTDGNTTTGRGGDDGAGSTAGFPAGAGSAPPITAAALVPFQEGGNIKTSWATESTPLVGGGIGAASESARAAFYGGSSSDGGDGGGDHNRLIPALGGEGGAIVGIDVAENFTGAEHESLSFCGRMMAPFRQLCSTIWEFRWLLLGTAGSWFIFDIVFYANGEFSGSVLEDMGWSKSVNKSNIGMPAPNPSHRQLADLTTFRFLTDQTPAATVAAQQHMLGTEQGMQAAKEALAATALGNLILALIGLPGYVVAVLIIDKLGRRNLQLLGFGAVAFIYTILGVALAPLVDHAKPALLIFYGLSFFFLNVGPNTSTFVIPAEAFPTRAKATCHGISAASGKLGAVIGAAMMSPLLDWYGNATPEAAQKGLALVLYACAAVSVLGFVWTFFFTQETSKISIEHLDRYGVHSFRMAKTKSRLRNRKSGAGGDYDEIGGGLSTLDESVSTGTGSGSNSNVTTPRGSNADAGAIGLLADAAAASDPADAEPHKQQKRLGLAGSSAALDIRQAPILNALSNSSHSSMLVIGNTTTTGYTTSNDLGGSSYSEGLLGASPASNFDLAETPPKPIAPNLPHVPGMLVSDEERAKILGRPWSPGMELNTTKKS